MVRQAHHEQQKENDFNPISVRPELVEGHFLTFARGSPVTVIPRQADIQGLQLPISSAAGFRRSPGPQPFADGSKPDLSPHHRHPVPERARGQLPVWCPTTIQIGETRSVIDSTRPPRKSHFFPSIVHKWSQVSSRDTSGQSKNNHACSI